MSKKQTKKSELKKPELKKPELEEVIKPEKKPEKKPEIILTEVEKLKMIALSAELQNNSKEIELLQTRMQVARIQNNELMVKRKDLIGQLMKKYDIPKEDFQINPDTGLVIL